MYAIAGCKFSPKNLKSYIIENTTIEEIIATAFTF